MESRKDVQDGIICYIQWTSNGYRIAQFIRFNGRPKCPKTRTNEYPKGKDALTLSAETKNVPASFRNKANTKLLPWVNLFYNILTTSLKFFQLDIFIIPISQFSTTEWSAKKRFIYFIWNFANWRLERWHNSLPPSAIYFRKSVDPIDSTRLIFDKWIKRVQYVNIWLRSSWNKRRQKRKSMLAERSFAFLVK